MTEDEDFEIEFVEDEDEEGWEITAMGYQEAMNEAGARFDRLEEEGRTLEAGVAMVQLISIAESAVIHGFEVINRTILDFREENLTDKGE